MHRAICAAIVILCVPGVGVAFHEGMPCAECHSPRASGREMGRILPEDDLAVCLRCHAGGTRAPDVFHDNRSAYAPIRSGGVRAAGALSSIESGGDRYGVVNGHRLGSTQPPPGFVGSWPAGKRLTCISCHAPHPNGNYRNLGPGPRATDSLFRPEAQPSFTRAGPDARRDADVVLLRSDPPYDPASTLITTRAGRNAMNEFCASCHTAFHGAANTQDLRSSPGVAAYVRHPTTGVPIPEAMRARIARSAEPIRLAWRDDGTPEVACVTCHRAHGTTNPFGLVYWDPRSGRNGENGAGRQVESLCLTCHGLDDGGVAVSSYRGP